MFADPKILFLSNDERETKTLEGILGEHARLQSVRDPAELKTILAKDAYDAMFCGWSYHQGTWQDALKEVLQQCPELPVIVFCRAGGEREWLEALEAGAFDLLVAPYVKRNVYPLLEHAIASSEARRLHSTDSYQRARVS